MSAPDVVLVTHCGGPAVDEDDLPLAAAIEALGLGVRGVPWDASDFDWSSCRAAVVRSTWDYHLRRETFVSWARRVEAETTLWNPADVLERNTHKSYLLDLARAGVPTVPTVLVRAGRRADLRDLVAGSGSRGAVVKPAVSIGSWQTARVGPEPSEDDLRFFESLVRERDVLVQPFVPSVETTGERCVIVLDGEPSHAVRKAPRFSRGDRVPPSVEPVPVAADEAAFARDVLAAAGAEGVPYARVDLARDDRGAPLLMELELTEPRLYLRLAPPGSAARLARAIARSVS